MLVAAVHLVLMHVCCSFPVLYETYHRHATPSIDTMGDWTYGSIVMVWMLLYMVKDIWNRLQTTRPSILMLVHHTVTIAAITGAITGPRDMVKFIGYVAVTELSTVVWSLANLFYGRRFRDWPRSLYFVFYIVFTVTRLGILPVWIMPRLLLAPNATGYPTIPVSLMILCFLNTIWWVGLTVLLKRPCVELGLLLPEKK
jgi:hypothetical protein